MSHSSLYQHKYFFLMIAEQSPIIELDDSFTSWPRQEDSRAPLPWGADFNVTASEAGTNFFCFQKIQPVPSLSPWFAPVPPTPVCQHKCLCTHSQS